MVTWACRLSSELIRILKCLYLFVYQVVSSVEATFADWLRDAMSSADLFAFDGDKQADESQRATYL